MAIVPIASVLVRLLATLALFRLIGLPLVRLALPGLPRAAWAVATTAGLVVSGHLTWLLCHAGLRLGPLSIALGIAATAALALLAARRLRADGRAILPDARTAAAHLALFTLAFAFALLVVARNPSVDADSERPMDLAFYRAVLASRSLPLEDPWLAAERVSYYDYGYYSAAYLALFAGEPDIFFNVAVALLYPALLAGAWGLGRDLAGRAGGLFAAFFISIAGNLDALAQSVTRGLAVPLDWFHGARVLAGGITEFPLFTLLWGDLHPYALALPLWPLLLAVVATLVAGEAPHAAVAIGGTALAVLLGTNTWDAAPVVALLLLGGVSARLRLGLLEPLYQGVTTIAVGILLALPFLRHAPLGGRGIARVPKPSDLTELLAAWGVAVVVVLLALLLELRRAEQPVSGRIATAAFGAGLIVLAAPTPGTGLAAVAAAATLVLALGRGTRDPMAWAAAAGGFGLVAGVEVLYVDDWYSGELERMNTIFKTYVEAWVLLGLATAVLLARVLGDARATGRLARAAGIALAAVLVAAAALYPLRGVPSRTGSLVQPIGLDVRTALRQQHPDDAGAIEALRQLPRAAILETPGDPYSWGGRFATFTGYPTVVGWGHHEMGWRNVTEPITERMEAVREAYRADSLEPARELAALYGVRWLVVGMLERKEYPAAGLAKFEALPVAARSGATVIYDLGAGR